MRPPTDSEHAAGSPRLERKRRHKALPYVEVFVGKHRYPGHFARQRREAAQRHVMAENMGCVGFLDGHVYHADTAPKRRVRVFLWEEPPFAGFRWQRVLPPDVAAAVLAEGEYMHADWRAL